MNNCAILFIGFILGIIVSASAVSALLAFHVWQTLQSIKNTLDEIE